MVVTLDRDAKNLLTLNVEVLQCQLLSLVGLLPEDQILCTTTGDHITSPTLTVSASSWKYQPLLRLFLYRKEKDVATPPDWQDICTRCVVGPVSVIQPAYRLINVEDSEQKLVCASCAQSCCMGTFLVPPRLSILTYHPYRCTTCGSTYISRLICSS